jgi:hypothetical protein
MLDHARTILASFCVCAPVLYIGLLMLMDPAGLVMFLRSLAWSLAGVLRTFEHRFHGSQWHEQLPEPDAGPVYPVARLALRFAGLALAVWAVAYLANAVD